jgi:mRNA interferase MazF
MVERFDVYLVSLDAVSSKDAKNTRPCVIVSPDEINRNIQNVIIAPLSAPSAKYPTRIETDFLNNRRAIILDQIRTVDKSRLVKKIGSIDKPAQKETLEKLQEMFAE